VLQQEMATIFQRTWLYVGDIADLAAPDAVKVVAIAGRSVLISRAEDGTLQAFHNVCPHRASPLFYETGVHHAKHWVCPYHGWVYDRSGQLRGMPAPKRFPDEFRCADFPLVAVRVDEWAGFVFVCFDPAAPPLLDYLHPIPTYMAGYRTADTKLLVRRDNPVACNWKNFHDNTLCDYHVAIAHRETLSPVQGPVRLYEHEFHPYVNLLYTPTTPAWRAENPVLEHLPERNRLGFYTFGIFPNLHLFAFPNSMFGWVQITPLTAETCQVTADVYGVPGLCPLPSIMEADFDATTAEDICLTEGVQRGYASGAYTAGVANGLEDRILHHQRLIRRYLSPEGSV
ncbi:MAG TPA: aromatic ring-hydroxylating dioxygenase subunit alpha, partial [Chroococcidiopsis sp.]